MWGNLGSRPGTWSKTSHIMSHKNSSIFYLHSQSFNIFHHFMLCSWALYDACNYTQMEHFFSFNHISINLSMHILTHNMKCKWNMQAHAHSHFLPYHLIISILYWNLHPLCIPFSYYINSHQMLIIHNSSMGRIPLISEPVFSQFFFRLRHSTIFLPMLSIDLGKLIT